MRMGRLVLFITVALGGAILPNRATATCGPADGQFISVPSLGVPS
jgi:hypothetical protein